MFDGIEGREHRPEVLLARERTKVFRIQPRMERLVRREHTSVGGSEAVPTPPTDYPKPRTDRRPQGFPYEAPPDGLDRASPISGPPLLKEASAATSERTIRVETPKRHPASDNSRPITVS